MDQTVPFLYKSRKRKTTKNTKVKFWMNETSWQWVVVKKSWRRRMSLLSGGRLLLASEAVRRGLKETCQCLLPWRGAGLLPLPSGGFGAPPGDGGCLVLDRWWGLVGRDSQIRTDLESCSKDRSVALLVPCDVGSALKKSVILCVVAKADGSWSRVKRCLKVSWR